MKFGLAERLPNAFNDYKMPVSIYTVDPSNFESFENTFGGEVRSVKPVRIIKEEKIASAYDEMLKLEAEGKILLRTFENRNPRWPEDSSNVIYFALAGYIETKDKRYVDDFKILYPHFAGLFDRIISYVDSVDRDEAMEFYKNFYDRNEMKLNNKYIEDLFAERGI